MVQLLGHQEQVGRVVIDHQYLQCSDGNTGFRRHYRFFGRAAYQCHLHADVYAGAQAKHTMQGQAAAHQLTKVATDRQAKAGTATRQPAVGVGLGKGQEQALLVLFIDANAAVLYRQFKPGKACFGARDQAQVDDDLAALGELDGVADQI
ncbi:hypothetical protein D3C77_337170 [compost metagenome]